MDINSFYEEIIELIDSCREDEYWDFKQCHHQNTAALLHDIICMANNRANRDAYIIFGVADGTYEIKGVETDTNRRNQQEMINQLKSKAFAGDVRAKVELRTLNFQTHELDILIIKNSTDTPYYLNENFRDKNKGSKS